MDPEVGSWLLTQPVGAGWGGNELSSADPNLTQLEALEELDLSGAVQQSPVMRLLVKPMKAHEGPRVKP